MKKVYLIATVIAIIAGLATYMFATEIEKKSTIQDAPTADVVVAKAEVPENTILTEEMLEVKRYTVESVVPGSAESVAELIGRLSRYPLHQGEQIIVGKTVMLGDESAGAELSAQLKKGYYAYTMEVGVEEAVSYYIRRGDVVDVMYTNVDPKSGKIKTKIILESVKVVRLDSYAMYKDSLEGKNNINTYANVTFELQKDKLFTLDKYRKSGGNIRLLLKSIAGKTTK